jgi:hypothetical protein
MSEQDLYRQLIAWLRSRHPLILAEWERERKQRHKQSADEPPLLRASVTRPGAAVEGISAEDSASTITSAIKRELESLGIQGGTPGTTEDGTPCIHLIKTGLYGRAYEESVTLARIRDSGYRRYLRQVFK